jgi:hypothetical protein
VNGVCGAKANCGDGIQNGSETGPDCGGTCPDKCPVGAGCKGPTDCKSGSCNGGTCRADVSCTNGQKDAGETDVDCGGPKCGGCAVTKFCGQHSDCLSGACVYGMCEKPTCTDGIRNQGESDIDCGGPCPACGVGGKCAKAGDCKSGACEAGTCCTPNACGICSDSPDEVCNGKDDDCNGKIDDNPSGNPGACPLYQGVCAGAVYQCRGGAGWICDQTTYKTKNWHYEEVETSCDGFDNDCDGQVDEGLVNACGKCAATPVEVCNGKDDDCDGQTDEDPKCAVCKSPQGPVMLVKAPKDWGFEAGVRSQALALSGDAAYVIVATRGYEGNTSRFFRIEDGVVKAQATPDLGDGVPALLPLDGGGIQVSGHKRKLIGSGGGYYEQPMAMYWRLDPAGAIAKTVEVGKSDLYDGVGWPFAQGGGTVGLVYNPDSTQDMGYNYATLQADGTFKDIDIWMCGSKMSVAGLAIRPDGTAYHACSSYKDGWFDLDIGPVGAEPKMVAAGSVEKYAAGLWSGPDGTLHVVTSDDDSKLLHRSLPVGETYWTPAETIGTGNSCNLAFDNEGRTLAIHVASGNTALVVATRDPSGTWMSQTVFTAGAFEKVRYPELAVDEVGRYHIGFGTWTMNSGGITQEEFYKYLIACQ